MTSSGQTRRQRMALGIAALFPGYFALVMATGIVSIAAHMMGLPRLGRALLVVNIAAYLCLSALLGARIVGFSRRVIDDLRDLPAVIADVNQRLANGENP